MAAVKNLCKTGILLKNGKIETRGQIEDVVNYYIEDQPDDSNKTYYSDLQNAMGNEVIKVTSFEISPLQGDRMTIASGVKINMILFCNKEDFIFDIAYRLSTMDDLLIVFNHFILGQLNETKKGYYSFEMIIPPYFLNKGKYQLKMWFGENLKYVIWYMPLIVFSIEDSYNNDWPGLLRTNFEKKSCYLGLEK